MTANEINKLNLGPEVRLDLNFSAGFICLSVRRSDIRIHRIHYKVHKMLLL